MGKSSTRHRFCFCFRFRGCVQISLTSFLVAICATSSFAEELLKYEAPQQLCELEKDEIIESSGLAASSLVANRFWTHNDSGDECRLFAFDRRGRHLGTCKVEGADFNDWEDMAAATINGEAMLIIGDVGDNRRVRESCFIYLAREPQNPMDGTQVLGKLEFEYEGGPVDCEAIAYDSRDGCVLLTEKTRLASFARGHIYELAIPLEAMAGQRQTSQKLVAHKIGMTLVPTVTAMDISRDGRFMIIGSYVESNLYERRLGEKWKDALIRRGQVVHMPVRRQGESICFGNNNYNLFATSEKRPTPLFEIPVVDDKK